MTGVLVTFPHSKWSDEAQVGERHDKNDKKFHSCVPEKGDVHMRQALFLKSANGHCPVWAWGKRGGTDSELVTNVTNGIFVK